MMAGATSPARAVLRPEQPIAREAHRNILDQNGVDAPRSLMLGIYGLDIGEPLALEPQKPVTGVRAAGPAIFERNAILCHDRKLYRSKSRAELVEDIGPDRTDPDEDQAEKDRQDDIAASLEHVALADQRERLEAE